MGRVSSAPALTYSIQDYLKSIYELTDAGEPAATNAIAARLGVSAASVTGMLQKLAAVRPALVSYKKHQGVRLTGSGRRAALQVIRHHRLLETWLVQTLGYSWDEVHGEAEKMEHVMSEDMERRISHALGNPVRDPHGEPIPSSDLVMPPDRSVPLSSLVAGQEAIVRRVEGRDSVALRHLNAIGVQIGSKLRVVSLTDCDELVILQVHGHKQNITLGPALTQRVYVEKTHGIKQGK
ncbi:MAG: metal-dependent transcriptional regulator [Chloroflexota bacterium]